MDIFKAIYQLIGNRKFKIALNLLVNSQTGRLLAPYNSDANHSWYVVGDILFKKKDYRGALVAFKKALKTRTDDYQALWAIGDCYSGLKKPAFAERYLKKALGHAPKHEEELRYDLGNALFDQHKFDEAIVFYNSIAKNNRGLFGLAQKNLLLAKRLADNLRKQAQGAHGVES